MHDVEIGTILVDVPELAGAIFLTILFVAYAVVRTSSKVPATVTFAKPTTVIPAGTAILAGLAVLVIAAVLARANVSPQIKLGLTGLVAVVLLSAGSSTTGNRVVYDRGGRRTSLGNLIGIGVVACFFLAWLVQRQ